MIGRSVIFSFPCLYYTRQAQVSQTFMYVLILIIIHADPELGHTEEESN